MTFSVLAVNRGGGSPKAIAVFVNEALPLT